MSPHYLSPPCGPPVSSIKDRTAACESLTPFLFIQPVKIKATKKSLLQTVDMLILKWNTVRNRYFLFYQPGCSRVKTALETAETIVLNTAWAPLRHSFIVAGKTKWVTHETVTSSFTSVLRFQSSFGNLSERCCNTGWMKTRCNHQQLLGKKRQ